MIFALARTFLLLGLTFGCSTSKSLFEKYVIETYGNEDHGWRRATGVIVANPVVSDERSVTNGSKLYQDHCSICHGDKGRGDGPYATALKNKPADLHQVIKKRGEYHIFLQIAGGREDMPAWSRTLTERDRWDLVNYIETFKDQAL